MKSTKLNTQLPKYKIQNIHEISSSDDDDVICERAITEESAENISGKLSILDSDCLLIEEVNNQFKMKPIINDGVKCANVKVIDSKSMQSSLQDDCLIEAVIDQTAKLTFNREMSIISDRTGVCQNSSQRKSNSDDCMIVSECTKLDKIRKIEKDCITLDDDSDIVNSSQSITKSEECILIDDEQDNEDITVTENLNLSNSYISKAFLFAEVDYVNGIKRLFEEYGLNLDCINSRRWTLLMIACFSGSTSVVRYLLSRKVDLARKDKRNNTAYGLAAQKGNKIILSILRRHNRISLKKNNFEEFYCEVCEEKMSSCSKKKHELSILHQSKLTPVQPHNTFHIGENNIGYQMLLKCGWNGQNGLGKYEQGNKFPINTETKNNRLGLGHKNLDKKQNKLMLKPSKMTKSKRNMNKKDTSKKIPKKLSSVKKSDRNPPLPHISSKNLGYQMLVNCGWNESDGLGKNAQGNKYPIRVQTKQNRLGIGHIKLKNSRKNLSSRKKIGSKSKNRSIHMSKNIGKLLKKMLK